MKNWLTKKGALLIALGGSGLFFFFVFSQELGLCAEKMLSCTKKFDSVAEIFQVFIPSLFLTLLLYKLRDEIFNAWLMFAKWWIPPTIILVLLAPSTGHSLVPIDKGRVSLFMNALFLLISLLLIAIKSWQLRKKG